MIVYQNSYQQNLLTYSNSVDVLSSYFPSNFKNFKEDYDRRGKKTVVKVSKAPLSSHQMKCHQTVEKLFYFPKIKKRESLWEVSKPEYSLLLPVEILQYIFALTDWNTVCQGTLVSKNFYSALDQNFQEEFEKKIPIFHHVNNHALLNFSPKTKVVFNKGQFSLVNFIAFLKKSPVLHSITFKNFPNENFDDYICALAIHAPNLRHLEIYNCNLTDASLYALRAAQIQLSSFKYCSPIKNENLTDYGLLPFLKHSKELESLSLSGCPLITELPLFYIHEGANKPLKHLQFSSEGMSGDFFARMHLNKIESLQLDCNGKKFTLIQVGEFQERFLDFGDSCSSLKILKLRNCSWLDNDTICVYLNRTNSILTEIDLQKSNPLTTDFIQESFRHPLRSFTFEPSVIPSDCPSFPLINSHQLEFLKLINCPISEKSRLAWIAVSKDGGLKDIQIQIKNVPSKADKSPRSQ